jgi:hypothetical protein
MADLRMTTTDTLDAYPVSRMINKPSHDSHALIQRVESPAWRPLTTG